MSTLRTRLARLERAVRDTSEASANQEEARRLEFFIGLGCVLAPHPEAKAAVGRLLESQLERRPTQGMEAADAHQAYREFVAVLAQYPAAQAAVTQWLENQRSLCGSG